MLGTMKSCMHLKILGLHVLNTHVGHDDFILFLQIKATMNSYVKFAHFGYIHKKITSNLQVLELYILRHLIS